MQPQTNQSMPQMPTDMSADQAAAALAHATYLQEQIFGQQNPNNQPTNVPEQPAAGSQEAKTAPRTNETPQQEIDTTAEIDALKTQFQDEIKTLKQEVKDDIKKEMEGIRKQIKDALAS